MGNWKDYWLKKESYLDSRYKIMDVIGEGGFGITYYSENTRIGLKVAIKELFCPDFMARNEQSYPNILVTDINMQSQFQNRKEKFLQEARIISDFSSEPGIVNIIDYFEANNTAYIVMEYLDGQNLHSYIKENGPINYQNALSKFIPIMKSLQKIHESGVIHRDISPNNIIVTTDGSLRLIDFGSARDYSDYQTDNSSIIVTGGYAPPEQYTSYEKSGAWLDVYSISATLYFTITGKTPSPSISRVLYDELTVPSSLGIKLPSKFEESLLMGMSIEISTRYQSIKQLIDAFLPFLPDTNIENNNKHTIRVCLITSCVCLFTFLLILAGYVYYESHIEEIVFHNEPVQHVRLTASNTMSASDYIEGQDIIKQRLKILTGNSKYLFKDKKGHIDITIPTSVLPDDVNYIQYYEEYLFRPCKMSLSVYNIMSSDTKILLSPDNYVTLNEQYGSLKNLPSEITNDLPSDTYYYFEIELSTDKSKELLDTFNKEHNLLLWFDLNSNADSLYSCFCLWDGNTRLYIVPNCQDQTRLELLQYNLCCKSNWKSLYDITYDISTSWENPSGNFLDGENQVSFKRLNNEKKIYYYNTDDTIKKGDWVNTIITLKNRLDSLGIPYAFGYEKNNKYNFVIAINPDKCAEYIVQNYITQSVYQLKFVYGYETYDLNNEYTFSPSNNTSENFDILCKCSSISSLRELTEDMTKRGYDTLYMYLGNQRIASASISQPIENGTIIFNKCELDNDISQKQIYNYILSLQKEADMPYLYTNQNAITYNQKKKELSMYTAEYIDKTNELYAHDKDSIMSINNATVTKLDSSYMSPFDSFHDIDLNLNIQINSESDLSKAIQQIEQMFEILQKNLFFYDNVSFSFYYNDYKYFVNIYLYDNTISVWSNNTQEKTYNLITTKLQNCNIFKQYHINTYNK